MRNQVAAVALAAVVALAGPVRADTGDRPPSDHLVWAGLGLALPTYFTNVVLHEGSHALVARWFGGEIVMFRVLPSRHPRTGRFFFGYVEYKGRLSRGEKTLFFLAPKVVNLIGLGGFTALVAGGAMPENHYGRLALTVLATGFWVDFSKDILTVWSPTSDINRALNLYDLDTFWERLPWRLLHIGLSAAAAYVVWEGYDRVFEGDPNGAARVVTPWVDLRF